MELCSDHAWQLDTIMMHFISLLQELSHLAMLQAHDLLDVLDLSIGSNLGGRCVPHIQELSSAQQSMQ